MQWILFGFSLYYVFNGIKMKKTININLGGIVFNIDDDAYMKLKRYLDQIEIYFANEKESREILSDIENRVAELFQERSNGTSRVIDMKDVDEVIRILGEPEEIGGPENGQEIGRAHV